MYKSAGGCGMGDYTSKISLQHERKILAKHIERAKNIGKYADSDPEKAKADLEDLLADFDSPNNRAALRVQYWTGMEDRLALMRALNHSEEDIAAAKKIEIDKMEKRDELRRKELIALASGKEVKMAKAVSSVNPLSKIFIGDKGEHRARGLAALKTINNSKGVGEKFKFLADVKVALSRNASIIADKKSSQAKKNKVQNQSNAIHNILHNAKRLKEVVKPEKTAAQK